MSKFEIGDLVKGVNHNTGRAIRGKVTEITSQGIEIEGTDGVRYYLTSTHFKVDKEK